MLQVAKHLLEDAAAAYPTLQGEFEKDLTRLETLIPSRGVHVFTVDLPAVCKHLDRCLAGEAYKLSGLPLTKRYSNRVVIPKLFRGLYLRVFDESGSLKSDYDIEAVFFLRQLLSFGKRASLSCSDQQTIDAVDEFVSLDMSLPEPSRFWSMTQPSLKLVEDSFAGFSKSSLYDSARKGGSDSRMPTLLKKLDAVSGILSSTLGAYEPQEWKFRHGPGAVAERTGCFNKYNWSNWSDRLESFFPIADCGYYSYTSWAHMRPKLVKIGSIEPSSRLVDVPKTYTKPRLIACEPSEHQWCQQNIWHYFCDRSRDTWLRKFVRFNDQTLNQRLCVKGSRDGSLCTIDLSAASDRITCDAVGQLFRRNPKLLLALQASRTRSLSQKLSRNVPESVELRKFSTMGSACTFPVESFMFLAVCIAGVLTTRHLDPTTTNIESLEGEVAVFGDDLIVPADSRELVVLALETLGFKINTDKSYWNGLFRESCGVDSYAGTRLTPAYWRSFNTGRPESIASLVDVVNNFHERWLLKTSSYLASTIRGVVIPHVGMRSGVCGFKSFANPCDQRLKSRWNENLQRIEVSISRLIGKVKKSPITDDSALLQYFTENPRSTTKWKGGVAQRTRLRMKFGWVPLADLLA
jgi:hypothetical protein